LSEVGLDASS